MQVVKRAFPTLLEGETLEAEMNPRADHAHTYDDVDQASKSDNEKKRRRKEKKGKKKKCTIS
jgi:hypothetical protein